MTPAEQIAAWREAALAPDGFHSWTDIENADRIASDAFPKLLTFAEAVLAWGDHMEKSAARLCASSEGDDAAVNHAETLRYDAHFIRDLAEQHLVVTR